MSGVSDTFDSKTVIQRTIHGEEKAVATGSVNYFV